jgi:anti-sigma factor RsiW
MKTPASDRCRSLLEQLSKYIDDDLTPAQRRSLTAHLRRCPCCQTMADSLKHTVPRTCGLAPERASRRCSPRAPPEAPVRSLRTGEPVRSGVCRRDRTLSPILNPSSWTA